MRIQTRGSAEGRLVGEARRHQKRWGRISVGRIACSALAAVGLLQACTVNQLDSDDDAKGGRTDAGSAGKGGNPAQGGSNNGGESGGLGRDGGMGGVVDVAEGGAATEPEGGDNSGGNNASMDGGAGAGGEPAVLEPGAAAPTYFHAGTRLKPKVLRGGGLEVLDSTNESSWYDTQTGEPCLFRKGEDGVERCFPTAGDNELTVYLDAACTQPAFVGSNVRCDGTAFNYISYGDYAGTSCASTTYRIGAPSPQSVEYYSNASDTCRSAGASENVRPLQKVTPETFVAVERVSRPRLDKMNAWVREGADGSWEVTAFHDPIRNAACSGLGPESDSDACIPSFIEPTFLFADSSCTRRVAYDYADKCGGVSAPVALLEKGFDDDGCESKTAISGLWEVATDPLTEVFTPGSEGCESSSVGDAKTYVQGTPIDVASLPQLDVIQVGIGSLQLPFYGVDDVPFFPVPGAPFQEAASGHTCRPYVFADGTWRCVSSTFRVIAEYEHYYESPTCSGDLIYPWFPSCSGEPPEPEGIIIQPFGCTKKVTQTLEFDGTVSAPGGLYHPTPSSSCEQLGFFAGAGSKFFRATKPINPATRFIPFERTLGE